MADKVPIYCFVGKEYVCQDLKLLKPECELKFISDILIMLIENEWTQKKYARWYYSFQSY